jgi:hypothetical protein
MKIFKRSKICQEGSNVRLQEIVNMNMGGYVPSSILNMMIGTLYSKGIDQMMTKMKEFK